MTALRVALIGNIAQNAYLLAKFLRRLGVEADSFDHGGGTAMWLPWWEQVPFDVETGGIYVEHFDWAAFAREHDSPRPPWAKVWGVDGGAAPWYDTQEAFQADLAAYYGGSRQIGLPGEHKAQRAAHVRALLARGRLSPTDQEVSVADLGDYPTVRGIPKLAAAYDVAVLCGGMAAYGVLYPPNRAYVTFEHSTMRHAPQRDTPEHRLLALAYQHADANILTNADCAESAWCLGLDKGGADRRVFIPHPVDEDQFCPVATDEDRAAAAKMRAAILSTDREADTADAQILFWQPARQAAPGVSGGKRNDRVLLAFRRYLDEAEPQGAPKAALMLSYWGLETQETANLIGQLGFNATKRVLWAACASKPRMLELYRAVDVVLDQFDWSVGSFGTTTVEALATGKPVITHLDPLVHEWCLRQPGGLGALPPVCQARSAPDIYAQMVALATQPRRREAAGAAGRRWVEQHHGWRSVAERHLALYERVLSRQRVRAAVVPVDEAADDALEREAVPV